MAFDVDLRRGRDSPGQPGQQCTEYAGWTGAPALPGCAPGPRSRATDAAGPTAMGAAPAVWSVGACLHTICTCLYANHTDHAAHARIFAVTALSQLQHAL